ncbi:arginase family protein [Chondromyces apiculatus]|uniref:Agmatinase n=1 Tax=Chondromyces apiculatus DSM 436 TaxID=1192034 RepID=A0A017T5P8_9BACT|nr:arginase family protein [Chondromyces apiculatus]EYF04573.1 Hypothetical protein CAP_4393 [Chondromyces apiculatus DSM 436]
MTAPRYVALPGLICQREGRGYLLLHDGLGLRLKVSARAARALDPFLEPSPLPHLSRLSKVARGDLEAFLAARVLVPEAEAEDWDEGPLVGVGRGPAIGSPGGLRDLERRTPERAFAVIGAPSEHGSHAASGAQHGPALIRERFRFFGPSSAVEAETRLLDVDARRVYTLPQSLATLDLGDVRRVPGEGLAAFGARLEFVVDAALKRGFVPVTLGGDHAISLFPLRALLRHHPEIGILHFDAHHDHYLDPSQSGPHSHASVFALAMREPGIRRLFQLGLRTLDVIPATHRKRTDPRIRFVSARELSRRSPREVFAGVPRDLPWYLSFDVDCMAPHLARETGTRELGGIGYYQGLDLIQHAARHLHIVGADFVEVARQDSRVNHAAEIVARYVLELLLARVPHERLTSYLYA